MTDLELAQSLGLVDNGVDMEVSDDGLEWHVHRVVSWQFAKPYHWITNTFNYFRYARQINAKRMRPMTHTEVFRAISERAVVRNAYNKTVASYWESGFKLQEHAICYSYTGTDADVWQKMEVEDVG